MGIEPNLDLDKSFVLNYSKSMGIEPNLDLDKSSDLNYPKSMGIEPNLDLDNTTLFIQFTWTRRGNVFC